MWKNFRNLSTNLLQCTSYFLEQQRTTFILKRRFELKSHRTRDYIPKFPEKYEMLYDFVEYQSLKKKPELNLVLIKDVPGIGMMGEKIKAHHFRGYIDLLLPKLAVYENSPEAKQIVRKDIDKKYSSIYSKSVENFFLEQPLAIFLSLNTPWVLQPWHIRVALRIVGITTYDQCIKLPVKEISGPNPDLENRDFVVQIVMNNMEKFPVRCRIYHLSTSEQINITKNTTIINSKSEPLFDEEKEEINHLLEAQEKFKKRKELMGNFTFL